MGFSEGNDFRVLSLCSGGAGLDEGLQLALPAARTVCWVEWEAFAVAELVRRIEEGELDEAPVWTDLRSFDGQRWRGVVDCITAGYPCQPFSTAGTRLGEDDPRHLWPHVRRVVSEVQPAAVFLENVPGHVSLGFREVCEDLEHLGYDVAAGLFSAAQVGASHKRERLFILGANGGAALAHAGEPQPNSLAAEVRARHSAPSQSSLDGIVSFGVGQANAELPRHQGKRPARTAGRRKSGPLHPDGPALPLFPPGPGDVGVWRQILERFPHVAPATEPGVCDVVDGLADDRARYLRLLGNGVVPLQAAYAFCTLAAVFAGD